MLEPSTAFDLIYVPQPKAEHTAIRKELRILEERLESAAETLLTRAPRRVPRSSLQRGGPALVVVIEVTRWSDAIGVTPCLTSLKKAA
jgi:hypothetical protein